MKLLSQHQSLFKSNLYLSHYQSNFGVTGKNGVQQFDHESSYKMRKPLIAMVGISEYDNNVFPNLECVVNDYKNVHHAFYIIRGYSIAYFNKKNQMMHRKGLNSKTQPIAMKKNTNVVSRHDIKLTWDGDEILSFNDQIHAILENPKYGYDGLIYFISCHGDTGGVIYDSSGNKIPLIVIFDKFNNQNCVQLRNKPKIYFVEACRGNQRTKRFANSLFDDINNIDVNSKDPDFEEKFDHDGPEAKQMANDNEIEYKSKGPHLHLLTPSIKTITHAPIPPLPAHAHPLHLFANLTSIEENDNKQQFKNVEIVEKNNNKENSRHSEFGVTFSKYNYNREIYANTEGYAVVEPGSIGAYMIRSVTQAIENDDIFRKDFNTIIHHTRKIMLKLMGTSVECAAQVIEDNNNIPKKVFFELLSSF